MAKKIDANKPIINTDPLNNAYFQDRMFFATEYYTYGSNALQQFPNLSSNYVYNNILTYYDSDFYNKWPDNASPHAAVGRNDIFSGRMGWVVIKYHGKNLFDKFIGILVNSQSGHLHFWSIENIQFGQVMTAPRENWKYVGWINPAPMKGSALFINSTFGIMNSTQLEFNKNGDALYFNYTYDRDTTGTPDHVAGIYKIPLSTAWDTKSVTYVDPTEASLEIYHEVDYIRGNNDGVSAHSSSGLYDPASIITGFSIDSNETEMRILSYARDQNYLYNQIYTIDDSPTFSLTLDSDRPQTFAKAASSVVDISAELFPDSSNNSSTGLMVTPDSYKKFPRLRTPIRTMTDFPSNYGAFEPENINLVRGGFNEDSDSLPALSYIVQEIEEDILSNVAVLSNWADYSLGYDPSKMTTVGSINKLKIPGYAHNLEYGVDGIDSNFGDSGGIVFLGSDPVYSYILNTHGSLEKNSNYIHGPAMNGSTSTIVSSTNLSVKTNLALINDLLSLVDIHSIDSSGISSAGAQKNTLISQLLNSQ